MTAPIRTIIDLASVVEAEDLELALDDALHRRVISLPRLEAKLQTIETKGRKGVARLNRLIGELQNSPRVPTKFERLLAKLLEGRGLPRFTREYEVRDEGRVIARVDFAYPELKIGVEADGFKWHSSPQAFRRDRERTNALTQLGWRLHRVTWWGATQKPDEMRASVASLLGISGLSL